ncbi:MAG TPA: glycosyltransferase family 39 protein [bacterium]|nr:glycosyltransferase family 39 protein [bacterium]
MKKSHFIFLLVGLVMIGSTLRLVRLGHASMWVDEVNSAFAARSLLETGRDVLPSGHGYGRAQLFTALVAGSFRLTGFDEFGARLPAAVFGILSILLVAGLARRLYGDRVALVSAFFMTFSNFEVGWSRVSRMYTLLQLFTLLILYFFLRGFESGDDAEKADSGKTGNRLIRYMSRSGISPAYLLVGVGLWLAAVLWVQMLAVFLIPAIGVYLLIRMMSPLLEKDAPFRWIQKYSLALAAGAAGTVLVWTLVPRVRALAAEAFSYTPPWAAGDPAATHPMVLLEFLISPWRFPLAAFFFIGVVRHVTRGEREGWINISVFGAVFVLLSFVFTHRTPTYLFYVYPLFLMVSAYGLVHWADSEILRFKGVARNATLARRAVVLLVAALFVISPWLRITLNIPRLPDGVTNLAVTPEEWREASSIVRSGAREGDVIVATLPQVALYYGIRADYGLNWANLNQAIEKNIVDSAGNPVDIYAGLPCVRSLEQLRDIVAGSPRGWMMVSDFHLTHSNYIPEEVRTYIDTRFEKPLYTGRGTVAVYAWDAETSGENAF